MTKSFCFPGLSPCILPFGFLAPWLALWHALCSSMHLLATIVRATIPSHSSVRPPHPLLFLTCLHCAGRSPESAGAPPVLPGVGALSGVSASSNPGGAAIPPDGGTARIPSPSQPECSRGDPRPARTARADPSRCSAAAARPAAALCWRVPCSGLLRPGTNTGSQGQG